jgi:hypothetical protein
MELTFKSIGNQRRIPAIRKTQTEAEDHKKMQHKRGEPSACAKEEANQPEWRQGGEAIYFRACKKKATTAEKPLRASL